MRKVVRIHKQLLLFLLFFQYGFLSFSQENAKKGIIVISGKIDNIKANEDGKKQVRLYFPKILATKPKTLHLTEDGYFNDTIAGSQGKYMLFGTMPLPLYLKPFGKYKIHYDDHQFSKKGAVTFQGDDTLVNRYFITKQQERTYFNPAEKRAEEDYCKYLENWKEGEFKRIDDYQLPIHIVEEERKEISYEYLHTLFLFSAYHKIRDSTFKPSEYVTKQFAIDYTNEDHYKKYSYYFALVDEHYLKQVDSMAKAASAKDTAFSMKQNRIKLLAKIIPNEFIRNSVIGNIVVYDLKGVKDIEAYYKDFTDFYTGDDEKVKEEALDSYLRLTKLKTGSSSPQFYDYTNYKGGKNSLSDYKGKFVFIDIWATWCGNCWNEFPYIRKMEEKYKDKNIVFLSISQDNDKEEWAKTIVKENLPGIQLLTKDPDDDFFKEYAVYGIPRYILIDPQGRIINYNTPRPSSEEELEELFKSVGL